VLIAAIILADFYVLRWRCTKVIGIIEYFERGAFPNCTRIIQSIIHVGNLGTMVICEKCNCHSRKSSQSQILALVERNDLLKETIVRSAAKAVLIPICEAAGL
jgi:hypothetical protein